MSRRYYFSPVCLLLLLFALAACCSTLDHCIPDGYHGHWYDYDASQK